MNLLTTKPVRQKELIKRATSRTLLRYAIIASGWVILGVCLVSEYHEYGAYFVTHFISTENLSVDIFHRTILLAPVMSTFLGYIMKKRDIAEENVRESEEKYRELLELAQEGIWTIDKDNITTFVNPSVASMLGYSIDEMMGRHLFSFMDDEGVETCKRNLERRKQGIKEQHDFEFIHKDGSRVYTAMETAPILDEHGNYAGAIAGVIDITERKQAEDAIRNAEDELRSVYNAILGHLTVISPDYRILSYNETVEKQFGGGLEGRLCYEAYQARDRVCPECAVRQTLHTKKPAYTFQPATSVSKSVEIYTYPVFDDKGEVSAVVEHGIEVAERTELEENYNRQRTLIATVFETTPDPMYIQDKEGKYLIVNSAFESYLNINRDEIIDKTVESIFPGKAGESFRESDRKVLEGETYHKEQRVVIEGRACVLDTFKMPLRDKDGAIYGIVGISRDITERKRAEENRLLLLKAVESLTVGVTISDTNGKIIYTNPAEAAMHGYDVEELLGKDVNSLAPSELWKDVELKVKSRAFSRESINRRRDGSVFPVHLTSVGVEGEDGGPFTIITVCEDITERKRAENALKESEERYRNLFDSARDAIFIADAESGVIVSANRQAEDLLGKPASEIIGMHQSELHPEEERKQYSVAFMQAVIEQRAVAPNPGSDIYVVNKEGRKIPVEISANVIEIEGKRLLQGIFRDVTERKAAERAAREGKQYLENVLNSIQDGLAIIALDNTIVMANPTIEKWYAHRTPVVGRKCYEVFRAKTELCDPCPCAEARDKGEPCFDVVNYYGPEGRGGTLELYGFPLADLSTGEVTGMVHYYRDITDRVALQAEAFRAAQLASVGELAAGVAHEINNPINGIINYAELLVSRLPKGSEENSISHRIIKEGDRISGIVSALLTFTRDDALSEGLVDVEDLVLESLSLTIAQLAKDGIDVRINIPEDMPKVNIKRQHLEQVFLNLINNARHALNAKYPDGHPGKTLEISGESMAADDIPHVRISFNDRGTGIAADIIDRVTEPFFTTKQKGSGTGLGLSISSSIIKNSGGTLYIESVEGEYTKVTLELPINGA